MADELKNAGIKIRAKVEGDQPTGEKITDVEEQSTGIDLMTSYFRLNPNNINKKVDNKLKEIYEWAKSRAEGEMDILNVLKDVRYKLAEPGLGTSEIDNVHKYVTLRQEATNAETRAKAMEQ